MEAGRTMSPAQDKFYWRLWAQLKKARALANDDRHAQHAQLGLPESHTHWGERHFDRWKQHCLAQAQPANYRAQIRQERMPALRERTTLDHYLTALEKPEAHAQAIARAMNRGGRIGQPMAEDRAHFDYADVRNGSPRRKELTLDDLDELELKKVVIAVKKECKRRWPRKENLLDTIYDFARGFSPEQHKAALAHLMELMHWTQMPRDGVERFNYEMLLVVLSVLRRFVAGVPAEPAEPLVEEEPAEIDIPF
jgi:hypothetical protein